MLSLRGSVQRYTVDSHSGFTIVPTCSLRRRRAQKPGSMTGGEIG
jgi:hypothetical protein